MSKVIELANVTKSYGKSRGVEDVTFTVESGTVFGFLGPNGAGKSTTINMLLDFIRPTKGTIKLFGLDAQTDSVEIHKKVGFLAGDMAMDRALTGWQQLEYLGRLRGKFDKKYVQELAERLDCRLERKFKTLSRGNKQKVGLIAALMNKPELLIMDEPTSGLDPLIQAEFNKILVEHKARGGTAFISSHVLSEVQEICDIVTFIKDGRVLDTKTVAQLATDAPKQFRLMGPSLAKLSKDLSKLSGVILIDTEQGIKGTYGGDINKLIAVVSKHKISDFALEDTDLEATFMKYYEGENNA